MTKEEKAALLAMCLGDGRIGKNYVLYMEHSTKQEDYALWKFNLLNKIMPSPRTSSPTYRSRLDGRTGNTYHSICVHRYNKYFKLLRRWMYRPDKTISRTLLNRMTPLSLAIWYMDDGNLRCRTSKVTGKVSSIQVTLSTHCPLDQAEVVQKYFEEVWGIHWSIYKVKESYLLCANTENGNKFLDLVRPHVIESMSYKVNVSPKSARPLKEGEDIV